MKGLNSGLRAAKKIRFHIYFTYYENINVSSFENPMCNWMAHDPAYSNSFNVNLNEYRRSYDFEKKLKNDVFYAI